MSAEAAVSDARAGYPFAIRRLSDVAGAEITGLDLAKPLSSEIREGVLAAIEEFHVLCFRGQALEKPEQYDFTLQFGEIEEHVGRLKVGGKYPLVHTVTNVDEKTGKPTTTPTTHGNYFWHTDKSYHAIPSFMTLLHAVTLPPKGGDTLFANMLLAYEALSDAEKARLDGMTATHSWEANRLNTGNTPATEEQKRERPPVSHPIVRTHASGRKSLYLGAHIGHVDGMDYEAGRAMLADLLERATADRFVYRHQWRSGDLVMWDNRVLLHRGDRNYDMGAEPRILHRTVIRGVKPV